MVFPGLDGAEDDESRALAALLGCCGMASGSKPSHASKRGGAGQVVPQPRNAPARLASPGCLPMTPGAVVKHRAHSRAMTLGLAGAAKFWMGDGDEIVDEIDRLHVGSRNPVAKSRRIQAGVTDVEINPTLALGIESAKVAHDGQRQFPAKAGGRCHRATSNSSREASRSRIRRKRSC